jgi:hypothetical protein
MKTINYRGGVLRFRIPSSWREECDDYSGGMFYDDAPDSGTLRVSVTTLKTPPDWHGSAVGLLDDIRGSTGHDPGDVVVVGANAYARYARRAIEDGTELALFYWVFANPVPPDSARIVHFSYTVLASRADSDDTQRELAMLHDEIVKTEFARQVGTTGN